MRFVLSDDEREIIALRRAVVEYGRERTRWDAGQERPHDEEVYLQLHADCSGSLWVEPSGAKAFRVLVFHSVDACYCKDCDGMTSSQLVGRLRSALEVSRIERDGVGFRSLKKRATPAKVSNG